MIVVDGLTKRYGDIAAVDDVSFKVARGEVVGFLGPNGAGKTTTLRMLTGFLIPTAGRIQIDGQDALKTDVRNRIGYMPEGVPLHHDMRVREYLRYRTELKRIPASQRAASIDKALSQADITDVASRIIGQLSKGYRQRVGLADALLGDPPLLVLDEPTAGLDPNQIRQVRALIENLSDNKTIFLSTHILSEVEASCDRVIIIRKGKKVGEGHPEALHDKQSLSVVVKTKASQDALAAALSGVGGIHTTKTSRQEDRTVAELQVSGGEETLERIFSAAVAHNIVLSELSAQQTSLEEVFAELTVEGD